MPRQIKFDNYRVEVTPADRHVIRIGTARSEHDNQMGDLDLIASSIKRHVDDIEDVVVKCDPAPMCEFCGSKWTEDSSECNGGCCGKDVDAMEAAS